MKKTKILSVMLGLVLGLGTLVGCTTPADPNTPSTGNQGQSGTLTVEDAIQHMSSSEWQTGDVLRVTGVITSEVEYKEQFGSYTFYLGDNFQVYSAKIDSSVSAVPETGDTITVEGKSKIYYETFEIAYDSATDTSPKIYEIIKGQGNNNNQGSQGGNQGNTGATGSYADCEHVYDFSTFTESVTDGQDPDSHELTSGLTIYLTDALLSNKYLRIYKQDHETYGKKDGCITSNQQTSAIKALLFKSGDKTGKLNISGSTDGTNWTQVGETLDIAKNTEYVVDFSAVNYTYFKIETVDYQIRLSKIGVDLK